MLSFSSAPPKSGLRGPEGGPGHEAFSATEEHYRELEE